MSRRYRGGPAPSDPHGPRDVARRRVWGSSRAAVIPADDGALLASVLQAASKTNFLSARGQKTSQTSVYIRCEHRTDAVLDLHDEHRLFRGALSPHRPRSPAPESCSCSYRGAPAAAACEPSSASASCASSASKRGPASAVASSSATPSSQKFAHRSATASAPTSRDCAHRSQRSSRPSRP